MKIRIPLTSRYRIFQTTRGVVYRRPESQHLYLRRTTEGQEFLRTIDLKLKSIESEKINYIPENIKNEIVQNLNLPIDLTDNYDKFYKKVTKLSSRHEPFWINSNGVNLDLLWFSLGGVFKEKLQQLEIIGQSRWGSINKPWWSLKDRTFGLYLNETEDERFSKLLENYKEPEEIALKWKSEAEKRINKH